MNESVRIEITASHKMADNQEHEIKENYDGKYYIKGDTHYILYDSLDEETKDRISNTIKYNDNKISIVRKGSSKSTMHFSNGEKHKSDYVTPFGTFNMLTDTKKLSVEITENMININMAYLLYLNDELSSKCDMRIVVS